MNNSYLNSNNLKNSFLFMMKSIIFLLFCSLFASIAYQNYPFTKFFSINLGTSTSTFAILFFIFNYLYDGFKFGENKISDVVYSINLSSILSLFFTYFQLCILFHSLLNPFPFFIIFTSILAFSISSAITFSSIYNRFFPPKKTIVFYSPSSDLPQLLSKINSRPDKYIIINAILIDDLPQNLSNLIKNCNLVLLCDIKLEYRKFIIDFCYKNNIEVLFKPLVSDIIINKASFTPISDLPILACNYRELSFEQKIIKRLFDISIAIILLIITFPIMLLTAIAIKLFDHGPIFFIQDRVTINNKVFKLYKFRSMIVDAEKDGIPKLAKKNDQRITPIGKFIRILRIDELPQIINILMGDMSIVGPRPERPELIAQNILDFPPFEYRTKVKAGMTGFAQIKGKYNTPHIDKLMMDLMYIESFSILLDLKLLFMTIKVIFIPESSEGI